jgi:hypothetical protein
MKINKEYIIENVGTIFQQQVAGLTPEQRNKIRNDNMYGVNNLPSTMLKNTAAGTAGGLIGASLINDIDVEDAIMPAAALGGLLGTAATTGQYLRNKMIQNTLRNPADNRLNVINSQLKRKQSLQNQNVINDNLIRN